MSQAVVGVGGPGEHALTRTKRTVAALERVRDPAMPPFGQAQLDLRNGDENSVFGIFRFLEVYFRVPVPHPKKEGDKWPVED
jgi:hypothetical protein